MIFALMEDSILLAEPAFGSDTVAAHDRTDERCLFVRLADVLVQLGIRRQYQGLGLIF